MRTRIFASLAGAALAVTSPAARAQDEAGLETFVAEGSVGAYRAGLNLTIKDHTQVLAAHYYYASTGKDIPLVVAQAGDKLTLEEPGGARMVLALTNADAHEPRPLTFATSTGLAGDWTGAGKALPVRFGFVTGRSGPSPARWYGDVTEENDAAFEARARAFLKGVTTGNVALAAKATSWPLLINRPHRQMLHNRKELAAHWKSIFTPAAIAELRQSIPHEMFVRNGMAMVANGTVWFDAQGPKR
ncbi:hypothetical protein [Novosphingobium percolationis]|uniref:hypothetical protein n=1 Tax=Novosphingobium percolationis TaxID=2871811 RepID=UPI001CD28BC0|nr:hypothetical protein [Novosphingobium percolationis]